MTFCTKYYFMLVGIVRHGREDDCLFWGEKKAFLPGIPSMGGTSRGRPSLADRQKV